MAGEISPGAIDRGQVGGVDQETRIPLSPSRNWGVAAWIGIAAALAAVAVIAVVALPFGSAERGPRQEGEAPLIKADDQPVKVRPEDPGGMQVPNRNMLVYRRLDGAAEPPPVERLLPEAEQPVVPPRPVAKPGSTTDAADPPPVEKIAIPQTETGPRTDEAQLERILTTEPAPVASAVAEPVNAPQPQPTLVPQETASADPGLATVKGAYKVQLMAVRTRDQAETSWKRLSGDHSDVLGGLKPDIERADLGGKGVIYRLRAGPAGDESEARALCAALTERKVDCLVVRPSG